jgi:hypothetical protein
MISFLMFIIYIINKYKIARGHLKGQKVHKKYTYSTHIRQKSTHNYVEKIKFGTE